MPMHMGDLVRAEDKTNDEWVLHVRSISWALRRQRVQQLLRRYVDQKRYVLTFQRATTIQNVLVKGKTQRCFSLRGTLVQKQINKNLYIFLLWCKY